MRLLTTAVLAVLTLAAITLPAVSPAIASTKAAAASSGCYTVYQPPQGWVVVCSGGGGTGGGPGGGGGGGGGGGTSACTLTLLSPAQIAYLGLGAPPAGDKWAAITCPGANPFGGVTAVAANAPAAPPVTPQELMEIAWKELRVPALKPETAPGLGADGLVGLPEWYWIPRGWRSYSKTVTVAGVSATVTATPESAGGLSFDPGGGLPGSSCDGPGAAYRAGAASACTYTYDQSSAAQPGGAYAAGVTVTWNVSWFGTGIPVTSLDTLPVTYPLTLKVAEGQALVTQNGTGP